MKRIESTIALSTFALTTGVVFGGGLDHTMNFANVTGDRIDQNVGEQSSNEKEVEPGDFDNDGDLDVVIGVGHSDFGQRRNKLYRNDDGVFVEVSGAPIIDNFSLTDVTRNAFFRDYDHDGWLDIIVVNDANTGGNGGRTKLFLNRQVEDGENLVFSHFEEVGLTHLGSNTGGAACGGVSVDNNGDGYDDLYVGNYPGPSQDTMYFNQGDSNPSFFTNMTSSSVPNDSDYTVDVAAGDMNGDGKIDLLVSNWSPGNYIYYNDLNEAGAGMGDYKYAGSEENLGNAGANENSMEPGDFDGDGDLDIYWSNFSGSTGDRIFINTGNGGDGKANFTQNSTSIPLFPKVNTSRKATVADLNGDGRDDIIVMAESTRPSILRNTSVNGVISFVDWTPEGAFPNGATHRGWHSAAFDSNGDGDLDIFLGGWTNDHLFENVASNELNEEDLKGGVLPGIGGSNDPIALVGSGSTGETDSYIANITPGDEVSIVLNGPDDYILSLRNADDSLAMSSNRGTEGVEEAFQVENASGGAMTITVEIVDGADAPSDLNGDGTTDTIDLLSLLGDWGKCKGCAADLNSDNIVDTIDLLALLGAWGPNPVNDYVLEVLAR